MTINKGKVKHPSPESERQWLLKKVQKKSSIRNGQLMIISFAIRPLSSSDKTTGNWKTIQDLGKQMDEGKKILDSKALILGFIEKFREKRLSIENLLLKPKQANRRRGLRLQTNEGQLAEMLFTLYGLNLGL